MARKRKPSRWKSPNKRQVWELVDRKYTTDPQTRQRKPRPVLSREQVEPLASAFHGLIRRYSGATAREYIAAKVRKGIAEYRADPLLPLPKRDLTLAGKYAVLTGIYNTCGRGDPINPWPGDDGQSLADAVIFGGLTSSVLPRPNARLDLYSGGIPCSDEDYLRGFIADVEDDLQLKFGDPKSNSEPSGDALPAGLLNIDELAEGLATKMADKLPKGKATRKRGGKRTYDAQEDRKKYDRCAAMMNSGKTRKQAAGALDMTVKELNRLRERVRWNKRKKPRSKFPVKR